MARSVFLHDGAEAALTMCTTADYPTPANRPVDSRLATVRPQQEFGIRLPTWESALQRFLGELRLDR